MKNNILLKISGVLLLACFVMLAAVFISLGLWIMQLIAAVWMLRFAGSVIVMMPLVVLLALADWLVDKYAR